MLLLLALVTKNEMASFLSFKYYARQEGRGVEGEKENKEQGKVARNVFKMGRKEVVEWPDEFMPICPLRPAEGRQRPAFKRHAHSHGSLFLHASSPSHSLALAHTLETLFVSLTVSLAFRGNGGASRYSSYQEDSALHIVSLMATGRVVRTFPVSYSPDASFSKFYFDGEVRDFCERDLSIAKPHLRVSKCIFVGDISVGKTCLINRFGYNVFTNNYKTTIGVDFDVQKFSILNIPFNLQVSGGACVLSLAATGFTASGRTTECP